MWEGPSDNKKVDAIAEAAAAVGKAKKTATGCILAFIATFFLIPLGFAFIASLSRDDGSSSPRWIVSLVLGGVFFLSIGAIGIAWRKLEALLRKAARERALRQEYPTEPWRWREDWLAGRITSSLAPAAIGLMFFAIFWNAIVVLVLSSAIRDEKFRSDPKNFLLVSPFPLVGAILLVVALTQYLRWKRSGNSTLELESVPCPLGGFLKGRVLTNFRIPTASRVTATLECLRRKISRSRKNDNETEISVVWREVTEVPRENIGLGPRGGSLVQLEIFIPRESEPTTAVRDEEGIVWQLKVRAETTGPDYVAVFEVPVFVTPESDSPEALERERRYRESILETVQPSRLSVRIRPTMSGGTEIYWSPMRHPVAGAISLVLFALGCVGLYFTVGKLPWVVPVVLGMLCLLFGIRALQHLVGFSLLQLEPDGRLIVRRGLAGFGKRREFAPEEVSGVTREVGSQLGSTPYYYLVVRLTNGKKIRLGTGMEDELETCYVEALVDEWLDEVKGKRSKHDTA